MQENVHVEKYCLDLQLVLIKVFNIFITLQCLKKVVISKLINITICKQFSAKERYLITDDFDNLYTIRTRHPLHRLPFALQHEIFF